MNSVLKKDFADLIFEGRNKGFGAYFLRRKYQKNITRAAAISIFIFSFALAAPFIYKSVFAEEVVKQKVQIVEVVLEDIPSIAPEEVAPPPPPATFEPPKVTKVKFLPPVVKPDEQVKVEEVPTTEMLKEANPGDETQQGETLNELADIDVREQDVVEAEPEDNKIYTWVEETAEFPGGNNELKKFLIQNLQYPKEALEKQISDFVVVKFVVNKDGSISDVKVVKNAGHGMDEEATRVIKQMPKWKPAKQNGSPARLEKSIKIPFVLK